MFFLLDQITFALPVLRCQEGRTHPGGGDLWRVLSTVAIISAESARSSVLLSASISWGNHLHPLEAFIDSEVAGKFMDISLTTRIKMPLNSLNHPVTVTALGGRPLGSSALL